MTKRGAVVRLQVPPTLGPSSLRDLREALRQSLTDPQVRLLTLAGREGCFCRGLEHREAAYATELETGAREFCDCLKMLRMGGKLTVALVDGAAQGGGLGLAAACDAVICSERSTFSLPEILFGLVPAMIYPLLLERLPPQVARLWALSGETKKAPEALALGLVDEVVPADRFERAQRAWVRRLLRAHPRGVAVLKPFSARVRCISLEEAIDAGRGETVAALQDKEVRRLLGAFAESGSLPWEDQ